METNWGTLIKEIGRGAHGARDLDEADAYRMFAAMLDGAVSELELGGIMIALRIKGESVAELRGFQRAAAERMQRLVAPAGAPRPVVLPSYNGARRHGAVDTPGTCRRAAGARAAGATAGVLYLRHWSCQQLRGGARDRRQTVATGSVGALMQ